MKRHALRRLRAAFLEQQVWAIYQPALEAMLETVSPIGRTIESYGRKWMGGNVSRIESQSGDPPTTKYIGSVAVLPICGVLQAKPNIITRYFGGCSTEILERDFKAAIANDQVKSIVLYCDTPGGSALGNEEAARTMEGARGQKPIVAFVRGMCASAGYYLASAAERIIASPSSLIGSVGTILVHAEYAKALEEFGLGVTVLTYGDKKGHGNQFEKLSPAAKQTLQQLVDGYGKQFTEAVARQRGVKPEVVRERFGGGQVFLAEECRTRGLVDAVADWETVLAELGGQTAPLPQPRSAAVVVLRGEQPAIAAMQSLPIELTSLPTATSEGLAFVGQSLEALSDLQANAESALTAGAKAGVSSLPASANQSARAQQVTKEVRPVKKIKAWLYANDLIDSLDVSDDVVKAVLAGYFGGLKQAIPEGEDKILIALIASKATAGAGNTGNAGNTAGSGSGANVSGANSSGANTGAVNSAQAAHDREMAEAKAEAAKNAEANLLARQKKIRESGRVLGIEAEAIELACSSNKPLGEVLEAWTQQLAEKNPPVTGGAGGATGTGNTGGARVTGDGAQRYVADATIATLLHFNQGARIPEAQITPQIRQMSNAPLVVHAQECLRMAGIRVDDPYDREAIAEAALAMDGAQKLVIRADGGIAYNRPGNFPNLLSALANKVLDEGVELADTSYEAYTGLWPGDLPDFKPAPVVAKGTVGELDEVLDAEEFKEQGLAEECLSYMQLARFGNHVKLTPVLLANDDLSAFMEDLLGLGDGWELTVNRGCLRLVTGNVTLLDGNALYHDANHGNIITAGGAAPSVTTWDAMQQKMAAQQTIGNKGRIRGRLAVALVPPKHSVAAIQAFAPMRDLAEMKQPAVDSNLNVFRGRVTVVEEPDLQDFSNDIWYGFTDPRRFSNATIIRAYFRGWGRRGKRERWYDPMTKCYYVSLEGRAGFAAKQYRTTVRNPGA